MMDKETDPAPSPFLPGTFIQYAWDSTSLSDLKRCPRLYYYRMIEGWSSRAENVNLRFGSEYHKTLEEYDIAKANGETHDEALFTAIQNLMVRTIDFSSLQPETDTEMKKSREALLRTAIWYLEQFKDDPAKTLILDNGRPAVELSFRFELDWGPKYISPEGQAQGEGTIVGSQPYLLCGHLDRVVEYQDHYYGMDRKTTTRTPGSYYFDQYEPDNQMSLYTLACHVIFETPVKGMIIDVAQILTDSSRFVRGFTYRSGDQLDEWVADLKYWFDLAESFANAKYWPMNDTACDKYGGCRFRKVCSKSPNVRENFLNSGFEKGDIWNPLRTR
jgi:hypothetical protein